MGGVPDRSPWPPELLVGSNYQRTAFKLHDPGSEDERQAVKHCDPDTLETYVPRLTYGELVILTNWAGESEQPDDDESWRKFSPEEAALRDRLIAAMKTAPGSPSRG